MPVDRKRAIQIARPLYGENRVSYSFPNCNTVAEAILSACDEHAAPALEALRQIAETDPSTDASDTVLLCRAISIAAEALEKYEGTQ